MKVADKNFQQITAPKHYHLSLPLPTTTSFILIDNTKYIGWWAYESIDVLHFYQKTFDLYLLIIPGWELSLIFKRGTFQIKCWFYYISDDTCYIDLVEVL